MVELIVVVALGLVIIWTIGFVSNIVGFIIPILLWMFVGYLAGQLLRGKGYGPLGDVALGLGGGVVGSLFLGILGYDVGFTNIIAGILGAVVLVYSVRLFHNADFAR